MSPRSLVLVLALLSISTAHDCYNTKCVGTDDLKTTIPCDESTNVCTIDSTTGVPTCTPKAGGGDGADCLSKHFYCTADAATGVAACTYTPSTCYDNMCNGTGDQAGKYIPCDQSSSTCGVDGSGVPTCTPGNIGNGVNCTISEVHDEYYCQNNLTTGTAQCVYPPKHDCYNSKCNGTGLFNETAIECDQSDNRCGVKADGSPICNDTTRGEGVDCSKDDEFYCSEDKDGSALCVVPPKHSCYDLKCAGTGDYSSTVLACNQTTNRCVLSDKGEPSCVNTTRGDGVNCFGDEHSDYYCANDKDSGAAVCHQTLPSDCYNTKCVGTGTMNTTTIDCDESKNLCQVNEETGAPLCVPLSRGSGVNCTHTTSLDFWCNHADNGNAVCVLTPPHSCYSLVCQGSGSKNTSLIACDGAKNRCSVDHEGNPLCITGAHGLGTNCNESTTFYCSYANDDLTKATCTYPKNYDCFNSKCKGVLMFNDTYIGCPEDKGHCSVNSTGFPSCVYSNSTTGQGVTCSGSFSCKYDKKTGVAACHKKSKLLPLWIILGIVAAVLAVAGVVWVVKRRSTSEDRQSLLSPAF